ncbi:unnamed protein product [Clonostachys chloroleuca]|uniref:Uncharacterized protein n=1 Tax=Clonostachys chloroleuca TaxID=1926264 RepID=A0AA35LRB7_9HYPO|nr:unnamed protein product [Clonostachys chloroleuca]
MPLLFGGPSDLELVHWASNPSVKIIVAASGGKGWLLHRPRKPSTIPSDSGYGSIQKSTSGYESDDSDASTLIVAREERRETSHGFTGMVNALSDLRFGSASVPSGEFRAFTGFTRTAGEGSVTNQESIASNESVDSMISFYVYRHWKIIFDIIDNFISQNRAWVFSRINELSNAPEGGSQHQMHTGSGGEESRNGSGSSSNSEQVNSNGTTILAHISGTGNKDNNEDDDGSPGLHPNTGTEQAPVIVTKELACPFYKHNQENREWKTCSKRRFMEFFRLLEHIKRKHKLKELQCERCLHQSASEHEHRLHVDSTEKCEIRKHGKIGQTKYEVLSSRSFYKGMSPEKRWRLTYCLLFITEGAVPSPYYEDWSSYELAWSDGHVLDHIRRRFSGETESTIQHLYSVLQSPQAENSILDEYLRRTGEGASEDLHWPRPSQPLASIPGPGILDRDAVESSPPNHDVLSWEETSSKEEIYCGQGELVLGKHPNRTAERPENTGTSWSSLSESQFSDVEMSKTRDVHLSSLDEFMSSITSPSIRSSDYEFSEQHQNLNHELTMHHIKMAMQDE